jgi:hypothetical protein
MRRLMQRFNRFVATELGIRIYQMNATIASRTLPKFGNSPKHLVIELPRRITNSLTFFLAIIFGLVLGPS